MYKLLKLIGTDSNSPLTLRVVVEPRYINRILGTQGTRHKHLQSKHDVLISLNQDCDDHIGRLCHVTGTVTNVARALAEIVGFVFLFKNGVTKVPRFWLNFLIPGELVNKLQQITAINGDGCILNDIAHETNTRITIAPKPLINTTEFILKVSAANTSNVLEQFVQATTLIGQQFQIHCHEALSPNNIYYTPFCEYQPAITNTDDDDVGQHEHNVSSENSTTSYSIGSAAQNESSLINSSYAL
ncbi:hypothetical protein BC941DRAFT_200327 [Chlamydoabsidia padenii]|nr:hypothetical protein BC941DRAFT_200327 [Chlamydoabsidia padenii]